MALPAARAFGCTRCLPLSLTQYILHDYIGLYKPQKENERIKGSEVVTTTTQK